ncbi:MAG: DNA cytosine methyltransferase [Lachnospiraceae bacterium]|nr:DNA cytosine methyltransferase [Lachnospiraceae bacterium]
MGYENYYSNRDVISLFSGAMGLDIGLQQAGLNIVIGQDFEQTCVETMKANGHNVLGGDIREIKPEKILDLTGLRVREPFLICGGPPCQPFSTAGKRLGINDPRGSLFMDYIRMIDYIKPRFFVMENVKGIMSSPLKHVPVDNRDDSDPDQKSGTVLDVILSEFNKLGYKTVYGILDAVNYGVPQFRERFVLIGSRDHEDIFLPVPTHFQMHQDEIYRWRTVGDAIKDLENEVSECGTLTPERKKYLKMVPEGGNWKDLPKDIVEKAMGGAYTSGGGKVGFYRRLTYSQPAPTVTTAPAQKATMLCHPVKDRPLSVHEYARLQQFPEDWIFTGTTAAKYKQIGNAVPVGLAKAIGKAIISAAERTAVVDTKRFRGTGIHNRIKNAIELGAYSGR